MRILLLSLVAGFAALWAFWTKEPVRAYLEAAVGRVIPDKEKSGFPMRMADLPESARFSEVFEEQVRAPVSMQLLGNVQAQVQRLLPAVENATVAVVGGGGAGSGVIISKDGIVLTAGHVSGEPGRHIVLVLSDGRKVEAESLGFFPMADAGVAKILEEGEWPAAPIERNPEATREGDWCFALGHPGGLDRDRGPVLRVGRIIRRGWITWQSDCKLLGGDSGGPLFNLKGQVIAIHSRISEDLEQNYHSPVGVYSDYWDQLIQGQVVSISSNRKGGFLGVKTRTSPDGVRISDIIEDSPAAEAGLQVDDLIQRVDGVSIRNRLHFSMIVGTHSPGADLEIGILRDSEPLLLNARLIPSPSKETSYELGPQ